MANIKEAITQGVEGFESLAAAVRDVEDSTSVKTDAKQIKEALLNLFKATSALEQDPVWDQVKKDLATAREHFGAALRAL